MTYPNRNWDKGEGYITELPNRCTTCDGYLFQWQVCDLDTYNWGVEMTLWCECKKCKTMHNVELKLDSDFDFTGSMELETEKVE